MTDQEETFLYHAVHPTHVTPGHACYVIIGGHDDMLQPNRVHLIATQVAEPIPSMARALPNSLILTTQSYLQILMFFKFEWPQVKAKCQTVLDSLRPAFAAPTVYDTEVSAVMECNVLYEKSLDHGIHIKFALNSKFDRAFDCILVETPTQSMILHPGVMCEMAHNLEDINEEIFLANFNGLSKMNMG